MVSYSNNNKFSETFLLERNYGKISKQPLRSERSMLVPQQGSERPYPPDTG